MSIKLAKTYQVFVTESTLPGFLEKLINQNYSFEILDPLELGDEWKSVQFLGQGSFLEESHLDLLSQIITANKPKGLLSAFLDDRVKASLSDIQRARENKEALLQRARSIDLEDGENDGELPLKEFAALHAAIELQKKAHELSKKAFKPSSQSPMVCLFISIDQEYQEYLESFFKIENVKAQPIDWNKEVVIWDNPGGLKAFQSVAESIGTISTKESDPTPVLSIFFMLFFAFCLGDAVYGLLLTAFTGYLLFFKPLKPGFKNFFTMFFYCGIATTLFGILTNSWAGDLFTRFFPSLDKAVSYFQLINVLDAKANVPVNQFLQQNGGASPILFMMVFSMVIGFLHIFSAYLLNLITTLKSRNTAAALGQIAWIFFIFSGIFAIAAQVAFPALTSISLIILAIGVASLFIFNEAQGIIGKILSGLLGGQGLYGIVAFCADLMSYTRLVANGLTGGIIATIVNLLAGLIYSAGGPIFGLILAVVFLIVGHAFNIVISLFSAYINPIRLSYVEFMPKFFQGNGRQLQPENLSLRYLELTNE